MTRKQRRKHFTGQRTSFVARIRRVLHADLQDTDEEIFMRYIAGKESCAENDYVHEMHDIACGISEREEDKVL